jgi:hypothetical protein
MNKIATKVLASGLTLAVAGCVTGAPRTTYHTDDPFSFLAHAASHGGVPVMVVGEPYPGRRADVESAAVAAMQTNFRSLGNAFRAVPPAAGEGTKMVFVFNGRVPTTPQSVCLNPAAAGGAAAPTMTLNVVYCGVGPYSDYWMSFPAPPAPDSPAFRERVAEVAYYAVPREINPDKRNSTLPSM